MHARFRRNAANSQFHCVLFDRAKAVLLPGNRRLVHEPAGCHRKDSQPVLVSACRYGGDEFVVLLSDNHDRADAVLAANKIRKRLSAPMKIDSQTLRLSVSIGIAMYPPDGPELSSMLRVADADMYRTKVKSNCTVADDAFTREGAPPRPGQ